MYLGHGSRPLNNFYLGVGLLAALFLIGECYSILVTNVIPYFTTGATVAGIHSDFQFYYEAAFRFIKNQEALYLDLSRDSFWGYLYPPPSIFLFLPFTYLDIGAAYALFILCSYIALVVSLYLWFQYCEEQGFSTSCLERTVLIIIGTATAPMYLNVMAGNLSSIILLTCVGYVYLMNRGNPVAAGFCLSIGMWVKLYPVILCILGLRSRAGIKAIVWTFASTLGVAAFLLPWLDTELYVTYFTDLLPRMSGRTIVNVVNQSLIAFLMRFVVPMSDALSWGPPLTVELWVQWSNICGFAAWCIGATWLLYINGPDRKALASSYLLAAIPIFSPLGWGHAYVLALPVMLLVFHRYASNPGGGWFARAIVLGALLSVMVPAYHRFDAAETLPSAMQNALYSRYLLVTFICCALQLFSITTSSRTVQASKPAVMSGIKRI